MGERGFRTTEWIDRNGGALRDRIQPKTVPLLILTNPENPRDVIRGSGVLVALEDRRFILTAGHCIDDAKGRRVVIPAVDWPPDDAIRLNPILEPKFLRSSSINVDTGTVDYGYLELHPQSASTLDAKLFQFTTRIVLHKASGPPRDDDWVAVGGYPGEIAQTTERTDQSRFMITLTLVALEGELPKTAPVPDGFETLDLLLPRDSLESPDGKVFLPAEPASHQGVSGGGCWTVDVLNVGDVWTPKDVPSLCAIHTGTGARDGQDFLVREVPVEYHLRMIADDNPELAPLMHKRWPELANVAPADSFR